MKQCFTDITALMKDILNHEFLSRLPESSRLLAFVFDQICSVLFANVAKYHDLLSSIIDTFIYLAKSPCAETVKSVIPATVHVHRIKQYCEEHHINMSDNIESEFKETVSNFLKRDEIQIQKRAALHFIDIAHVLQRKTAQRLYVE